MALHKDFPASPFDILDLAIRWFPAGEVLRGTAGRSKSGVIKFKVLI